MTSPFTFTLPDELAAVEPPESRGVPRDQVRLMVIDRTTFAVKHSRFDHIGDFLQSGDLLVFNASRTLPASLAGCEKPQGPCLEVRLAEHLADGDWLALLVCQGGEPFACGLRAGMKIQFGEGLMATVGNRDELIPRLWRLRFSQAGSALIDTLYRIGQPIRYEYAAAAWDLDYYQTVYAREPGSAEMPSAGRAITWKLLFDLKKHGIGTAQILLHTGLSSYMDDDLDKLHLASEEEYLISEAEAQKINRTRERGGRVIAVGTTVVRALETVADAHGRIACGHGYTRLRITADHNLRAVDGLLTGLHEPEASHLDLLTALLPAERIRSAYAEAIERRYLWHEFGDLNLIV